MEEKEETNSNRATEVEVTISPLMELRNAIVEGDGEKVSHILEYFPDLVDTCIESKSRGNYPIHWAAVAINGYFFIFCV